jgi:hypothetical protein
VQLDASVILQALLWLPSPEAFRAGSLCRELQEALTLNKGEGVLQLWHDLLASDGHETAGVERSVAGGSHSHDAIWLHGIMRADQIAIYVRQARRFTLACEVAFQTCAHVSAFVDAIDAPKVPTNSVADAGAPMTPPEVMSGSRWAGAATFVLAWTFDEDEVRALVTGGRAHSRSVVFSWQTLQFYVQLTLIRVARGGLCLAWTAPLFKNTLLEAMDYIEVDFSGSVVTPSGFGAQMEQIQPGSEFERRVALDACADSLHELLHGQGLITMTHVQLRCAGEALPVQLVAPCPSSKRRLSSLRRG